MARTSPTALHPRTIQTAGPVPAFVAGLCSTTPGLRDELDFAPTTYGFTAMAFAPRGLGASELVGCVGNGSGAAEEDDWPNEGIDESAGEDEAGSGDTDDALDAATGVFEITTCPATSGDVCEM